MLSSNQGLLSTKGGAEERGTRLRMAAKHRKMASNGEVKFTEANRKSFTWKQENAKYAEMNKETSCRLKLFTSFFKVNQRRDIHDIPAAELHADHIQFVLSIHIYSSEAKCPHNKTNTTSWDINMNFLFSWEKQYLTS